MHRPSETLRGGAACVLAAIAALCLIGFAPENIKSTLQVRYDTMKAAIAAHDGAAVAAILAPDFTSVDTSGQTETAAQMIDEVRRLRPDLNKSSVTTLETIALQGEKALVRQRYDMRTIKVGPDGIQHKIELVTVSADTWIKSRTVWLMQRTVTNELSYYLDGVVIAHKVRR